MLQDDPSSLNGNKDSLGFDGMADSEVERRLKVCCLAEHLCCVALVWRYSAASWGICVCFLFLRVFNIVVVLSSLLLVVYVKSTLNVLQTES